jgi:hypothetical protein
VQKTSVEDSHSILLRVLGDEKRLSIEFNDEAVFLALQLIIRAAETPRMSTWFFLEVMIIYLKIQAEAQVETDRICDD